MRQSTHSKQKSSRKLKMKRCNQGRSQHLLQGHILVFVTLIVIKRFYLIINTLALFQIMLILQKPPYLHIFIFCLIFQSHKSKTLILSISQVIVIFRLYSCQLSNFASFTRNISLCQQFSKPPFQYSIIMSKYITIDDRLIEFRQAHRQVITGTLSKLSIFRSSLSLAAPPKYLRQKVSLRIKKEQDNAMCTHEQSLQHNYKKLKHNLHVYARSKSLKLQKAFERMSATASFGNRQPLRQDLARLSYKSEKDDRTIFIDRKYNRQFAISSAMVSEITDIANEKCRIRKLMSEKYVSPLAKQTKIQCANSPQAQGRQRGRGAYNPVLIVGKYSSQLKKKKKGYEYDFGVCKNRK